MTIGDYGSYISTAGCSIGGFGGSVNGAGAPTLIDAVFASGAGTAEVNGLYIPDGTTGGRTRYTNALTGVSFAWNGEEYRIGASGGMGDLYYGSDNIAGAPNSDPWDGIYITNGDGADPPPTVRQATSADS